MPPESEGANDANDANDAKDAKDARQPPGRNARGWFSLYGKGAAMGIAELVPGVSGGTIAFISGIYDELLITLGRFRPSLLGQFVSAGPRNTLATLNLPFLLVLFAGMLTSIVLMADLLHWLQEFYRVPLWGYFFGLIAASIVYLAMQLPQWKHHFSVLIILGWLIGYALTRVSPLHVEDSYLLLFLGGAIAISAWILPGVSGSFMLLLMGLYIPVLEAISSRDLLKLASFALGCGLGLVSFARVLGWCFERFRAAVVAILCGFMLGALWKLWPWQIVVSYLFTEGRDPKPLLANPTTPWAFMETTGEPAYLGITVLCFAAGIASVLLLQRWGSR